MTFHPTSGGAIPGNPMTTLGDMIYENSQPTAARLAGNTSAAKQFLTQTGTGAVSAAPAWGTIANSDLPYVAPWIPADNGLLVATNDPALSTSNSIFIGGTLYLAKLMIREAITATNLWVNIEATGNNTGGSGGTFAGLYSSAGALLTGSSDVASSLVTTGPVSLAFTTPQALSAGTFVWAAILCNLGTTQPTVFKNVGNVAGAADVGLTAATRRWAVNGTGLAALPSPSITPGNNLVTTITWWAGIS